MTRNWMKRQASVLLTLGALALWACESRVSQKNFERIQNGMKMPEVVAILGEPSSSSGLDLGVFSAGSASWEGSGATISLQFLNGQVALKTFTKEPAAQKSKGP
jgi:hypothetical protein